MPETLFRRASAWQTIALVREDDGSLSLTLDDVWQFSSLDEARFHEMLVDVAMALAPRIEDVAILGGGDGLALRNALRYPLRSVTLCELDAEVVTMAREVAELRDLNANAFADPRVQVVVDDAVSWLERTESEFDVVICDFPAPTDPGLERLHDAGLFARVRRVLRAGGVASAQVSLDPPAFWSVVDAAAGSFSEVSPRLVELDDDTWADFVLASDRPLRRRRALTEGLTFLTSERIETTRISNRAGPRFHTAEYGDQPNFEL